MKIDVIIPTYKPDEGFIEILRMLEKQSVAVNRIIVMNTDRKYWNKFVEKNTYEDILEKIEVYHLIKRDFDHGRTRNTGMNKSDADICVMMTMDALPVDETLIEKLIEPLKENDIAACYARQIGRPGCSYTEMLTREFNYPVQSSVRTKADIERLQIKAYFCSNVCCAYNKRIFDSLGGFVDHTIFNEDMIYAAKALNNDYRIAYCAEAKVYHSHEYSATEQFKRNFDNGVSHAQYPDVFADIKQVGEGAKMVKVILKKLMSEGKIFQAVRYIWISGFKFLGFKLGSNYEKLPKKLIRWFSTDYGYFSGK